MTRRIVSNSLHFKLALLAALLILSGCYAHYQTYSVASGGADNVVGEAHVVNFPAHQTFVMLQDVLRGDGVLFVVKPDRQIVTEWHKADISVGTLANLVGVNPRYRYEIQVVPLAARQSKIVANVRAKDIPQGDIDRFKPSVKLHLFKQFDQYASQFPPAPTTPSSGGVNFALLPGENLRHLAQRVTGNADNWRAIAKANNLKSATDLAGVQSVWVPDNLLPKTGKQQQPPASGAH